MRKKKSKHKPRAPVPADSYYELEVIPGLAEFAQAELQETVGARLLPSAREDRVCFHYTGKPRKLLRLRQSVAVHVVKHFAIPRPKALLGHQNLESLLAMIQGGLALHAPGSFETFHISAAGSDSSVFARIEAEIEARTGLQPTQDAGHLLLAVRRPQRLAPNPTGWEAALRLSPRPLSARPWRVCDMPGALNATIASVMLRLAQPSPDDCVVNLACGSGTLLIERLALGPARRAVGCDLDARALACAQENLAASGLASAVTLVRCDAGQTPLPSGCATTACVDLPFGMLVGAHQVNERLYPRVLAEAGRLVMERGTMAAITQEVRLFERIVAAQKDCWEPVRTVPIKLPANTRNGYIRPRIYLLRRR
jgi:tRNA (guanine6-N2)-methyltransferase